jgi:hypothetical protein
MRGSRSYNPVADAQGIAKPGCGYTNPDLVPT